MAFTTLVDVAGRRRSAATLPGYHQGRIPRNKGLQYPADLPTVEEIIAVMRSAGDGADGVRLRGLIIVLWRAGLRISEALALSESDLDVNRGSSVDPPGQGRQAPRSRDGPLGLGAARALVNAPLHAAGRRAVLRPARTHPRAALDASRSPSTAARRGPTRRGATPVCSSSAAPRPRGRDVTRRRPAAGHPTPARARQSRDHLRVSTRHRQHRDRPHRSRTASPDQSPPTTDCTPSEARAGVGRPGLPRRAAAPSRRDPPPTSSSQTDRQ